MVFAQELQAMVMPEGGEFRLCNTICEPTSERQNALKRLVDQDHVDLILAIGGRKSSNTARLAEVGNRWASRRTTSSGPRISRRRGWRMQTSSGSRPARRRRTT